jgi:creatinine amidohydrolase
MTKFVMAEMSSREFREALRETDTALLPVASTEVLGDQGPLGADTFVAEAVARKVAERTACLVAPTIPVGDASELRFWPGTIWIDGEVLGRLYLEICNSLVSHGIRRILFLNAHLGNLRSVDYCGRALRRRGVLAAQADWWRVAFACGEDLVESIESPKGHGGEILASVVLAASPVPVDFAAVPAEAPKKAARYPAKGTAEKGRIIIDRGVERIAAFVVELKSQPLPETRPDF